MKRHRADPVERYLRRLAFWLPPSCRRDMVAEARRHLYDTMRQAEAAGLPREVAWQTALRQFGPAWRIGIAARAADDQRLFILLASVLHALGRLGRRCRRLRLRRQRSAPRPSEPRRYRLAWSPPGGRPRSAWRPWSAARRRLVRRRQ